MGKHRHDAARPVSRRGAPAGGRRKAGHSHKPSSGWGGKLLGLVAVAVSVMAVVAGIGLLPIEGSKPASAEPARPSATPSATTPPRDVPSAAAAPRSTPDATPVRDEAALPADSGSGKRVVFSEPLQRVWLVDGDDRVVSTYLVSGSVTDNLKPGTYEVYSRSRWAVGIEDSGTMEYFVRFTKGENAAIGFHTIPTKDGEALQTEAELGSPRSHGCIRQRTADAIRLWEFAPDGTTVVVL